MLNLIKYLLQEDPSKNIFIGSEETRTFCFIFNPIKSFEEFLPVLFADDLY